MTNKSVRFFIIIFITTIIIGYILIFIQPFNLSIDLEELENLTPITYLSIPTKNNQSKPSINISTGHLPHIPMDKLIIGNPLKSPQCRYAIINKENVDITNLLKTHLPKIYDLKPGSSLIHKMIKFLQYRRIPQLWGREQLNALKHNVEWWSGSRAHVSYDPFWYFNLSVGHHIHWTQKELNWQQRRVKEMGNEETRQRPPYYAEMIHFKKAQNDNIKPAMYEWNKLIDIDGYNNTYIDQIMMKQVAYYHIPKCGSTSMKFMLSKIGGTRINWKQSWFDGYPLPSILHKKIQCGFTFVRHPIHRFISAYYTFNIMLYGDVHRNQKEEDKKKRVKMLNEYLKHWNIVDECYYNYSCLHRVHVFVDQLVTNSWRWINDYNNFLSTRVMEHVGSITGHFMAGYDGWNIDYIGRVEYFEKHWQELSQNISECSKGYLDKYWDVIDDNTSPIEYRMRQTGQYRKNTLNRTLVDAYYAFALDKELYDKLIDYYYQDFICFGYDMKYESFMQYILEKDPSFNRNEFPENLGF